MGYRRAVLLVTALVAVAGMAAAADFRRVTVGGSEPLQPTVMNPLDAPDRFTITFSGSAVERGLVTLDYPANGTRITCRHGASTCEVAVPSGGSASPEFELVGARPGRGRLTVTVNSSASRKSAAIETLVIVRGPWPWEPGGLLHRLFG